ncbi:hypothetical protein WMY93_026047 [Mugilogobius chulae]|uniref:Uncharacterized protein n=1 Tax=Mugilogobius chulae TaxID=88201 RepID=A0AAW0MWJ1_9GOBI
MRTILLAVLLLQLFSQETLTEPLKKYGDIIAFKHSFPVKYKHFGIYIDKLRFEEFGQKPDDDLFHITRHWFWSACKFGKMSKAGENPEVFNYLDEVMDNTIKAKLRPGSEAMITERIRSLLYFCKRWRPLRRNCEHLSTYVRYGIPICLQLGETFEGKCHFKKYGLSKDEQKVLIKEFKLKHPKDELINPDEGNRDMDENYDCEDSEKTSQG